MSAALSTDEELARRAAALGQRATADHPEAWRPDDPAKGPGHPPLLVGTLVRVEDNRTSYGPCKIAVLRSPDGVDWSVWLLHTVLKQEFATQRPQIGELVAIRYLGRVEARDGKAGYESYRVVVDRQDAGDVWDGLGDERGAPAAADELVCDQCGFRDPEHAAGCIPF